jgi:hypothetical protein
LPEFSIAFCGLKTLSFNAFPQSIQLSSKSKWNRDEYADADQQQQDV